MQRIATRVFIYASVVFGILGVLLVLSMPQGDGPNSTFNLLIMRLLLATVFIILPAFALSIAGKYLNGKQ